MKLLRIILGFLFLLTLPITASAETGIKLGMLLDGEMYLADYNTTIGTSSGLHYGVFFDMPINEKLQIGLHFDTFSIGNNYSGETMTLTEIGGHIKPVIEVEDLLLRPYVGLGYGSMPTELGTSSHLLIQAGVELASEKWVAGQKMLLDFGFITSPSGGISGVTDITFDPIFFIRGGVAF